MSQVVCPPQATETKIIGLLVLMGEEVEITVGHAIESLLNFDEKLVSGILQREAVINEMEINIDAMVFKALEDRSLDPAEARSMAFILKANKDLERLGDLATNIARRVREISVRKRVLNASLLQPMAIAVSHIIRKTLRALAHQDLTLASNVLGNGSLDCYRDYVFRQLQEQKGGPQLNDAVTLLLASRYLEQVADYATNLAENLVMFLNEKRGQRSRDGQLAS